MKKLINTNAAVLADKRAYYIHSPKGELVSKMLFGVSTLSMVSLRAVFGGMLPTKEVEA